MKLALIVVAVVTVIVQVAAVPLHAPPQPAKVPPPVAVDVSWSCVPCTTSSLQSPLCDAADMVHAIPGAVTVPVPVLDDPATTDTKNFCGGGGAKLASTVVFWLTVSAHVAPVPAAAHAPPHPVKLLPPVAAAVSVS